MRIWNFCHNTIGLHVYEVLAIAVAIIMVVFAVIHIVKSHRRAEDYEKKLEELREASAPSEEEAPEAEEGDKA